MATTVLATAQEIRAIFDRATHLLDELDQEDDDDLPSPAQQESRSKIIGVVLEAFRFCALAAGTLGDPSLAGLVIDIATRLRDYEGFAPDHDQVACLAVSALLAAGAKTDASVLELARSRDPRLRLAVARGLRPAGEPERRLLDLLLQDPVPGVRNAAKAALAGVADVPWWTGKWKSDPAARLLPGEAQTAGPALRRVSELLDLSSYTLFTKEPARLEELLQELARLPHELAIEAAEQLCRASDRYDLEPMTPLFLHMLGRPGGADMLDRLVEFWGRRDEGLSHKDRLAKIVAAAPHDVRLAVCRRCIERVLAAPQSERRRLERSPAIVAATIAGKAWPPGQDITPVLDALLSLDESDVGPLERDFARSMLDDALTLEGVDPSPVLDRLVQARLAGYPGPWANLEHNLNILLGRAPREVLRRTAEQALHSEDPATVRWAMEQLLGPAHDPADGPLPQRAAAFAADPRLRSALFAFPRQRIVSAHPLVLRALPALRASLRRGELAYREAIATFEGIAELYGGLAHSAAMRRIHPLSRSGPPDLDEARRRAREKIAPFLAPPELAGPPTEAEREALRRARAASTGEDLEGLALLWMQTLSEGPWTPEERATFDEYMALFRGGEIEALDHTLGTAIASKPTPDMLPLLDEIIRKCSKDVRSLLQYTRSQVHTSLGIQPPPAAAAPSAASDDDDGWDDEENPSRD